MLSARTSSSWSTTLVDHLLLPAFLPRPLVPPVFFLPAVLPGGVGVGVTWQRLQNHCSSSGGSLTTPTHGLHTQHILTWYYHDTAQTSCLILLQLCSVLALFSTMSFQYSCTAAIFSVNSCLISISFSAAQQISILVLFYCSNASALIFS